MPGSRGLRDAGLTRPRGRPESWFTRYSFWISLSRRRGSNETGASELVTRQTLLNHPLDTPILVRIAERAQLASERRSTGCMVRSLVFAFPVVPRNYTWFDAANNRGLAPRTASHFALRAFREVANPSRCQGLVGSVYSPSLAEATVYGYTFLLATHELEKPNLDLSRGGEDISGVWFSGVCPQQYSFGPGFGPVDLSTVVVAPTTCSLTTCLTTCMVYRKQRRIGGGVYRKQRRIGGGVYRKQRGKLPGITVTCGNFAEIGAWRTPQERLSAGRRPSQPSRKRQRLRGERCSLIC